MGQRQKRKLCKLLRNYGRKLQGESDPEDWDVSKFSNIEFFYGVIFDQGIRADLAWDAPSELKKRLGHLNPRKIAKMDERDLTKIMRYPKSLHRYRRKMPNWIIEASNLLVEKYDGKPQKIWSDSPRAGDLQRRFTEFKGIGQKKASMATNILVREKNVPVRGVDLSEIDVSSDVHVRRVFLRSGLIDADGVEAAVRAARLLNPKYPGELDLPAWYIGKQFCHPRMPDCPRCPLSTACPKRVNLNAKAA
jgi:uncharacterized HhH-GPD family protein